MKSCRDSFQFIGYLQRNENVKYKLSLDECGLIDGLEGFVSCRSIRLLLKMLSDSGSVVSKTNYTEIATKVQN